MSLDRPARIVLIANAPPDKDYRVYKAGFPDSCADAADAPIAHCIDCTYIKKPRIAARLSVQKMIDLLLT